MGKLRDTMQKDMDIRGLSPRTQSTYLGCMKGFVKFYMKSPEQLDLNDIYNSFSAS